MALLSDLDAVVINPRGSAGGVIDTNDALHPDYTHVIRMSMSDAGFGSTIVLKLTGVTYRQLDYWARTGLVGSSIRQAAGRGSRRGYSFQDLVALRVVARLLDAGVSLQAVRRAVEYLKQHADRPLSTLG